MKMQFLSLILLGLFSHASSLVVGIGHSSIRSPIITGKGLSARVISHNNVHSKAWQPSAAGGSGGNGIRLRGGGGGGGGGDGGDGENPAAKIWAQYLELLDSKPLQTRMITGSVIGALGDILSQLFSGNKLSTLDLKRILIFSTWGGVGFTPVGYRWYNWIEKVIPQDVSARFVWKMLLDQSIFPGIMTAVTFMTLTVVEGLFSGVSFSVDKGLQLTGKQTESITGLFNAGIEKVQRQLWPTLIDNYKIWPIAQILNFAVVPLKLQVLFVNIVAVWWNCVLSLRQHH